MVILRTPRQTKNCLLYVIQNALRHKAFIPAYAGGVDPYSSGWWFDGWKSNAWRKGRSPPDGPAGVCKAKTWLLSIGWKEKYGPIGIGELPAAARGANR